MKGDEKVDPILEIGTAAILAGYLVAFYKMAAPASPSWALVLVALLSGVLAAALAEIVNNPDDALVLVDAANILIQGILAAAAAAGLTRTDAAAQSRREDETR